ncbi:MAG: strawberry notch C-terminal domain-containing protein [Ekhidna sp.]
MDKEVEIEETFVQNTEQVAAMAEQDHVLVPYVPKSKAPFKLNTLIPRNMAFEVQKALNKVIKQKGNIDNYVRNELKYTTTAQMWKGLGAEQVDSVAQYLAQFEKGQGIIIADQTGIGKGRQAASVIRHAIMNGYLPIFFSRQPSLFSDMYRDLKSIDFADIKPFIVNTDSKAIVKDASGHAVFTPLNQSEQAELISTKRTVPTESVESRAWHRKLGIPLPKTDTVDLFDVLDHLPSDYNVVFSTYSQVQAASIFKRLWLAKLASNGVEGSKKHKKVVFILDESHMAGGYDSIIGEWMRSVLPKAKACCYLSATFAKYPEVMPLYAQKTSIKESGLDNGQFVRSMQSGGLALQEIVASNLAESGQLVRRQRSNEGILVDYITLSQEPARTKNRERVNRIIQLMIEVVKFEELFITPHLSELHKAAKKEGEHLERSPKGLGIKQSPYFSRVFNIIDQMLFALKVEEVVNYCIKLLNQDKKVVIAFKSTMGAFLKDLNLVSGDAVDKKQMDFARTLVKGLDSLFYYNYTNIEGKKSRVEVPLDDLPQVAIDQYHKIKEEIWAESSGLTISPIDELIQRIQSAKKNKKLGGHNGSTFKVAEVTGRNQRIRLDNGEATVESFRSDTEKSFRLFNNGDYDVLLINQSGSTGSSAHASEDFNDQRVRAMIIHQFELDINVEVQKRGRTNRTGQIVLPEYYYIISDIPLEQRLMTMLKGKLKSLDANTTGSQKTSDNTLKSPDFFNKYGDKVAWNWVNENKGLMDQMGWPTYHKEYDKALQKMVYKRNESKEGAIKQVTGRAGLLMVDDQDRLYQDLLDKYNHQIEWEKQRGTYDLETEFLKLDADIKKRFLFQKGKGGSTPFGKDTVRDESIVNNLKRPYTKDEVDKILNEALKGKKAAQIQADLIQEIKIEYPKIIASRKEDRLDTIGKLQKELIHLPELGSAETDEKNKKLSHQHARLKAIIHEKTENLNGYVADLENIERIIIQQVEDFQIGQVVKVPILGTNTSSFGIFLGIGVNRGVKNPYTLSNVDFKFAVTDHRKVVEYSLTEEQRSAVSLIYTESKDVTEQEISKVNGDWNELIKAASAKREKRHILTENILAASELIAAETRLIKYNTTEGSIKNGVMLPVDYGNEGEDKKTFFPISHGKVLIEALKIDGSFSDVGMNIRFKRVNESLYQVFISKQGNFELYTSPQLRSIIEKTDGQSEDELPEFVQNAGEMTATLDLKNLERFLEQLNAFGLKVLGEAKELESWEIENNEDWDSQTKTEGVFRYRLGRPYGQGSNPTSSFVNYEEPNPDYPFGVVVFHRPLTDKEKYNYSLIPIFNTVEEPYQAWKAETSSSALKQDFEETIKKAEQQGINQAILALGYFITSHPHEEGNPEFVFGEFPEQALGRAAYEDMIGEISPLNELIEQLTIELQQR